MNRRHGFTLVEVLIGAAIASVLLAAAFSFWRGGMSTTEIGLEILNVSREMNRLSQAVSRDSLKARRVLWANGPLKVSPDLSELKTYRKTSSPEPREIILETDDGRIIYRFQPRGEGFGTVERAEEFLVADTLLGRSVKEFAQGITVDFDLLPLENRADGSRSLFLRMTLSGSDRKRLHREFQFETILCPPGLSLTTWNSFD